MDLPHEPVLVVCSSGRMVIRPPVVLNATVITKRTAQLKAANSSSRGELTSGLSLAAMVASVLANGTSNSTALSTSVLDLLPTILKVRACQALA